MILALLAMLPVDEPYSITRDPFGVPVIRAGSAEHAWEGLGRAMAQDRLWQLEMSRRLARGRLAEINGPESAASDRDILRTGYTDEELQSQLDRLPVSVRVAFRAFSAGVNDGLRERTASGLPEGYARAGFVPERWSELDSAAIAVWQMRIFGTGGAGELRNLGLLGYLRSRAPLKGREVDVLDDLAWQNDPRAPTTVSRSESGKGVALFAPFSRATTEAHLKRLPALTPLEVLPAVRLAGRAQALAEAANRGVLAKAGSYAAVVAPRRSSTGKPLLLAAPEMGIRSPSPVYEAVLRSPELNVSGIAVPGVPAIVIGQTRSVAWTLTSGASDNEDIVVWPLDELKRNAIRTERRLRVKGAADQVVVRQTTDEGPVIFTNERTKTGFSGRSAFWGRELDGIAAAHGVVAANSAAQVRQAFAKNPMSFNVFYATMDGDIGFVHTGRYPIRAPGLDPRLPTPAGPEFAWRGLVPFESLPQVQNPSSGLLTNWNNKPASWWPNGDTPVWGRVFRVTELDWALSKPNLSPVDVELAAWRIARRNFLADPFARHYQEAVRLLGSESRHSASMSPFDGWNVDGSLQARMFELFVQELRRELFEPAMGSLFTPETFQLVLQPSLMLEALEGRTKFDYLRLAGGRQPVLRRAIAAAQERFEKGPRRFVAGTVRLPVGEFRYGSRGSYIGLVEFLSRFPATRSALPPGNAESGPHAADQLGLSQSWTYKPVPLLSD
jgi:penicillin amidase